MQHDKTVSLHRSSLWRHQNGRIKSTGRGRRSKAQDDEVIGLASGVIDILRERGSVYAWQLLVVCRQSANEFQDTSTKLLRGSEKTISALRKSGLPAGLILYASAYIAETRGGLEYDTTTSARDAVKHREAIKKITGTNPSGPATILASDSTGKLIRGRSGKLVRPAPYRPAESKQTHAQAREDARQSFDFSRQLSSCGENFSDFRNGLDASCERENADGISDPTRSRKRGTIHKVPQFRDAGLSKQTCSKWRNDPRLVDALRLVIVQLGGELPSAHPVPLFRL